jgi:GxxExxY protein
MSADPPRPSRSGSHRRPHHGNRPGHKQSEDPVVEKLLTLATEVFTQVGPGFPEAFYRQLFVVRLQKSGLLIQTKPRGVLKHRDKVAAEFTSDLLIEKSVVLDLADFSGGDFTIEQVTSITSAQKFLNVRHGLLLGFSFAEVKHRIVSASGGVFPTLTLEEMMRGHTVEKHDELRATMLCRSLMRIGRAHGLGFGEGTYRGLLRAEFTLEALDFADEPSAMIRADGLDLGEAKLIHVMTIQRSGALLIVAQQDSIRQTDRQRLKAALKYLKLPWGMVAHFGRRRFEWQWIK